MRSIVKKIFNRLFFRLGFQVIRPCESNLLQSILIPRLHDNFFFVQIGANDGRRFDPIHDLVTRYKLAGLVVEPLSDMFEELKSTYRSQSQVQACNLAIHRSEAEVTLFRVRATAQVPDWAHGIASLNPTHFRLSGIDPTVMVQERVPAVPLKKLFDLYGIYKFDFLQIDTEGYDSEIIRMLLETNYRPSVIQFEHGIRAGIMKQNELSTLLRELMNAGYLVATEEYDAIAFLP